MANIIAQPNSPNEWQQYATSDTVAQVPQTKDEKDTDDVSANYFALLNLVD